ncbi:MAG: hypothetical protein KDC69_10220, partial [Flavobacteriaceae bacterium]|nr:hypothetical protein [Flavobacteriaceae bacterium]
YRGGILRSVDQGETWGNVGFENNVYIFKIIQTPDGKIFTSATFVSEGAPEDTKSGVFVSIDDGLTWQQTAIEADNIKGVFNPRTNYVFASGTGKNGLYRSTDNGITWSSKDSSLPDSIPISAMVDFKGTLFASIGDPQDAALTIGGGIYKSEDLGLTWTRSDEGISPNTKVTDLTILENTIFASTGNPTNIGDRGVFKSDDFGKTWQPTGLNNSQIRLIRTSSSEQLIAGSNAESIFISNDKGQSWTQTGKEIENWMTYEIVEHNNYLFASAESGIWRAKIPVKEWEQIRTSSMGSLIALPNGNLLAADNGAIFRTEDIGEHWTKIAELGGEMIYLSQINPKLLVACPSDDGLYFSIDDGREWAKYEMGMFEQNSFSTAIETPNGALLVGTYRGTLRSPDHGKTWENVDENFFAWSFTKVDDEIYAGGYASGIHKSSDDGLSWVELNSGLREDKDYLTVTTLCAKSDGSIFCGTLGEGIYRLEYKDSIWRDYNTGLTNLVNFGLIEGDEGTLYTTSEKGIFKRSF